jgi:hypothetical protein
LLHRRAAEGTNWMKTLEDDKCVKHVSEKSDGFMEGEYIEISVA